MRKTKIICTIGPATASYDMFPNFKVRGERFRDLAGVPDSLTSPSEIPSASF